MNPNTRIIVNTSVQYVKAIINILLSLYATRIILHELNIGDYGIYSVVAGVVGALGYLTNALVVTTQRYLSFHQGAHNTEKVRETFFSSVFIHAALSLLFFTILLWAEDLIIDKFLIIPSSRICATHHVYLATIIMLIATIIVSPFKAMLISHENIIYISVVEIADAFLKLGIALTLIFVNTDKLVFYAYSMTSVIVINLCAFMVYVFYKYEESHIKDIRHTISFQSISQLISFAGWTFYGMIAGVCQTQGTSVLFNRFFGTAANAAYGLATQVNGAVRFVSTSILNAMNPQIMKAEGNNDRNRMLSLAAKESKYSTAMMTIISIPVIIEMPSILVFWLKEVPEHTALLCRAQMLAFLFDQLTLGLHTANQATGKIRTFSIMTFTPKIAYLLFAWLILRYTHSIEIVMVFFISIEIIVAISRIPYLHYSTGLDMSMYISKVFLPLLPLCITSFFVSWTITKYVDIPFRFITTLLVSGACSIGVLARFTLSDSERNYIVNLIKARRKHDN